MAHHRHSAKGDLGACLKKIIQLNEEIIKEELRKLVQSSIEETLNGLLEKEAEGIGPCQRIRR